jgi:ADP-ribosylglycohydrolase/Fic family protein
MTETRRVPASAARGVFLGAAAGDALGWPQEIRGGIIGGQKERDRASPRPEFRSWTRHAGHYATRYPDLVGPGEYSDDTQLLLATARCCLAGERWWDRLTEVELPTWPLYQRGGGGAVLAAAGSWADGRPPWRGDGPARTQAVEQRYRGAGANGVAMRIAPHVLWAEGPDDLIWRVVRDGITTHGHPRALVGALVYAFALRQAASSQATHGFGDSVAAASAGLLDVDRIVPALPSDWGSAHDLDQFAATWQDTNKETEQLLTLVGESLKRGAMSNPEATLEQLGCTDPKINGAGTVTAAAAIYLASRFAARPQDGLLSAAFLRKADTDTLASMTAAILGALHDTDWLGTLAVDVQDADYIAELAERCAARVPQPPPWPTRSPRALRRALRDLVLARRAAHGEFPDGREFRLGRPDELHDGRILRARLRLDDGQTALVDLRVDPSNGPGRPSHGHREPLPGQPELALEQPGDSPPPVAHGESSAPPPGPPAPSAVAEGARREPRAMLATRSVARSASFYAQLTGRDIPVRAGTAQIAPGVHLHQPAADAPIDASAVVEIHVNDLRAAARRLGVDAAVSNGHPTIEVRDPDGRTVRVGQQRDETAALRAAGVAEPPTAGPASLSSNPRPRSGTPGRWFPIPDHAEFPRSLRTDGAFLPAPLPAEVSLRPSTYRLLAEAQEALGRLDEAAGQLPDRTALLRATQLRELRATANQGGGDASLQDVLLLDLPDSPRPTVNDTVRRYLRADDTAVAALHAGAPLDVALLAELSAILTGTESHNGPPWREELSWLGGPNPSSAYLIAAPPGPDLMAATEQWSHWVNSQPEMPLVAKIALGHYQLALLAPFTDGGLLARRYITLELIHSNTLRDPILPIASWLRQHDEEYGARLRGVVNHGNLDAWVSFIATGIHTSCHQQIQLIGRLERLLDEQLSRFRHESTIQRAVSGLIGHPITTTRQVAELHDISPHIATDLLARLRDAGLVISLDKQAHTDVFVCPGMLQLVNPLQPLDHGLDILKI